MPAWPDCDVQLLCDVSVALQKDEDPTSFRSHSGNNFFCYKQRLSCP